MKEITNFDELFSLFSDLNKKPSLNLKSGKELQFQMKPMLVILNGVLISFTFHLFEIPKGKIKNALEKLV
jgi:hypothetical protein